MGMLWYIYDIQHFIFPSHNNTLNFPVFEKKNPVCALHRHIYIYMYKQVSIFTLELHTWNYLPETRNYQSGSDELPVEKLCLWERGSLMEPSCLSVCLYLSLIQHQSPFNIVHSITFKRRNMEALTWIKGCSWPEAVIKMA